jgi:hypothetical protein
VVAFCLWLATRISTSHFASRYSEANAALATFEKAIGSMGHVWSIAKLYDDQLHDTASANRAETSKATRDSSRADSAIGSPFSYGTPFSFNTPCSTDTPFSIHTPISEVRGAEEEDAIMLMPEVDTISDADKELRYWVDWDKFDMDMDDDSARSSSLFGDL